MDGSNSGETGPPFTNHQILTNQHADGAAAPPSLLDFPASIRAECAFQCAIPTTYSRGSRSFAGCRTLLFCVRLDEQPLSNEIAECARPGLSRVTAEISTHRLQRRIILGVTQVDIQVED